MRPTSTSRIIPQKRYKISVNRDFPLSNERLNEGKTMSENTSQIRVKVNRINAKKSTGPKTAEGKRSVRHNAVRHGLYSHDIIINSPHLKESAAEYDRLLASLIVELKPAGLFQQCLVRRIADCLWRLRRVTRAETAEISRHLEHVDTDLRLDVSYRSVIRADPDQPYDSPDEAETARRYNMIGALSLPTLPAGINIIRYEMRLDRQLTRTLRLLLRVQKNSNFTTDLQNLGALKNEETKPTILPSQPPQTPDPPTTCDDSPTADKKTEIAGISD